ncbi:predicted protein [Histoplasma capsulatum var. duboisii H88]|uniref:Predicted protein n=2 Tax=Ajellomyces capsulatus TaxID=5037 RepID=F0U546_AJEC8|nr:predicted protein [Histoplasma capsulatum H143]EGC41247.1 predicted protein [Histoplasma capsulatum var. duboisii H88]
MDRRFTVAWHLIPVSAVHLEYETGNILGQPGPYRRQHHQTLVPGLRDVTFPPAPLPSRPALPDKINSTSPLDSPPLLPPLPPPSSFLFAASVSYLGKPSGYPDLRRNLRSRRFKWPLPSLLVRLRNPDPDPLRSQLYSDLTTWCW